MALCGGAYATSAGRRWFARGRAFTIEMASGARRMRDPTRWAGSTPDLIQRRMTSGERDVSRASSSGVSTGTPKEGGDLVDDLGVLDPFGEALGCARLDDDAARCESEVFDGSGHAGCAPGAG